MLDGFEEPNANTVDEYIGDLVETMVFSTSCQLKIARARVDPIYAAETLPSNNISAAPLTCRHGVRWTNEPQIGWDLKRQSHIQKIENQLKMMGTSKEILLKHFHNIVSNVLTSIGPKGTEIDQKTQSEESQKDKIYLLKCSTGSTNVQLFEASEEFFDGSTTKQKCTGKEYSLYNELRVPAISENFEEIYQSPGFDRQSSDHRSFVRSTNDVFVPGLFDEFVVGNKKKRAGGRFQKKTKT